MCVRWAGWRLEAAGHQRAELGHRLIISHAKWARTGAQTGTRGGGRYIGGILWGGEWNFSG